MNKKKLSRLTLHRESLLLLDPSRLREAVGQSVPQTNCGAACTATVGCTVCNSCATCPGVTAC